MTDATETGKITFENGSDSFMPADIGSLPDEIYARFSGDGKKAGTWSKFSSPHNRWGKTKNVKGDHIRVKYIRADLVDDAVRMEKIVGEALGKTEKSTSTQPDELLPCPKTPPLMPRFGLGDIVEVYGEYAGDWRGEKLVITGVLYEPKRDRLTYWTCPADDPTSEGATTDWDERDLSLYQTNKFNTRPTPRIDDQVDAELFKRELYRAMQRTRLGATDSEKVDALKDYITAHYNLSVRTDSPRKD